MVVLIVVGLSLFSVQRLKVSNRLNHVELLVLILRLVVNNLRLFDQLLGKLIILLHVEVEIIQIWLEVGWLFHVVFLVLLLELFIVELIAEFD